MDGHLPMLVPQYVLYSRTHPFNMAYKMRSKAVMSLFACDSLSAVPIHSLSQYSVQ